MIYVKDLYSDGNAFSLLGKCMKASRKAGWSPDRWAEFRKEAMSGDYDHLLQTMLKEFEELQEDD